MNSSYYKVQITHNATPQRGSGRLGVPFARKNGVQLFEECRNSLLLSHARYGRSLLPGDESGDHVWESLRKSGGME